MSPRNWQPPLLNLTSFIWADFIDNVKYNIRRNQLSLTVHNVNYVGVYVLYAYSGSP